MNNNLFSCFVSPKTGIPLHEMDGKLITPDGKGIFIIKYGVVCLLDIYSLGEVAWHEMEVFDNLAIQNVSYFRERLFDDVVKILRMFKVFDRKENFIVAEMGGGEGHWGKFVKKEFPDAIIYISDLSFKTLERVPENLYRVCADISQPIFKKDFIDLVSFWVSLHHLEKEAMVNAIKEASKSLHEGGFLIAFEPNKDFWLRKIMYRSPFSRDVYFDDKEKAIDFKELSDIARTFDLLELGRYFLNPPYNTNFIRELKRWKIYLFIVEILYRLDVWLLSKIMGNIFSIKKQNYKKYFTLYGLAIYKKVEKGKT